MQESKFSIACSLAMQLVNSEKKTLLPLHFPARDLEILSIKRAFFLNQTHSSDFQLSFSIFS